MNQFQAAGGPAWVIRELADAGYIHSDVLTVDPEGLAAFTRTPLLNGHGLEWEDLPIETCDDAVVRPATRPFSPTGGLKLLEGNLGRAVMKVSAIPADRYVVEAPAVVFDTQEALQRDFKAGLLNRDMVAVFRFQGPRANGMPELHKLTPPLVTLQDKGFRVAIVTDGRMSGASGEVPAAIHVSPEVLAGGPLGKVRTGDIIRVDAANGTLDALVPPEEWAARPQAVMSEEQQDDNIHGLGRDLFGALRRNVLTAEEGAITWL